MNYTEALDYLNSFVNYEELTSYDYKTSFKLERMRLLSSLLGDPHKDIKAIHITGTKGKGSTAAITASILKAAGFHTGLYTSPHLISFRERIKLDGGDIEEGAVAELVEEVKGAVEASGRKDYTFFELYTAAAFLYFKKKKTDIAVIEVGLGGRLDATNLLQPLVACVTPISFEHTNLLGPTLEDIAGEKAAIIKEGCVCVSAPQPEAAERIITSECEIRGVRLYRLGKDILYESLDGKSGKEFFNVFGAFTEYPNLEMGLLGEHQVMNAATAIGIIEALRHYDITIPVENVRRGVAEVSWPARMEVAGLNPTIILDGAQNGESAAALKKAVKKRFSFERLILVLGVSKDKSIPAICGELGEISDEVILTKADNVRAEEPLAIKKYINEKTHITYNVDEAMDLSRMIAGKNDLILVAGSFFVIGEVKKIQNAKLLYRLRRT